MNFITDEHKSFIRLKKVWFKCVKLLYTSNKKVVYTSRFPFCLGLLLKKILFCKTHEEFKEKYTKFVTMCYDDLWNYDEKKVNIKKTEISFIKIGNLLGITPKGEKIDSGFAHAPLFCRVLKEIPTTNNYAEAFHRSLNEFAADRRLTWWTEWGLWQRK